MGSRSGGDSSSEKPSPTPTVVKYARRRASVLATTATATTTTTTPCGACKFLRRKCTVGCVFAAHFASEQGAARFAAVHKVFGASNVSKLLLHLPPTRRRDAVATICYEAQARLSDPVYGCVATVLALQQQVAALQAELSVVQANLMNTRLAVASAIQNPQNPHNITTMLNTTYSKTSDHLAGGPHRCFDLASFPEGPGQLKGSQEDAGESGRNPIVFVDDIFQQE